MVPDHRGRRLSCRRPFYNYPGKRPGFPGSLPNPRILAGTHSLRKLFIFLWVTIAASAWAQKDPCGLVLVKGGTFRSTKAAGRQGEDVPVPDFLIGRYEVTQKEWTEVMGNNPSTFKGDRLPVETVSWYDCIEYCNRRSIKEGLHPCYSIGKDRSDPDNRNELDDIKWTVISNPGANGYRLPTDAEWEYAARGGRFSKGYAYSGSDDINEVAWYWINSGDRELSGSWYWSTLQKNHNRTKPVGAKIPNELGLYDMSGNVREWCWEWNTDLGTPTDKHSPQERVWRGGCWMGADYCCKSSFQGSHQANGKGPDQGFRVCRSD